MRTVNKRVQAYYLSDEILFTLQRLVLTLTADKDLRIKLGLQPKHVDPPIVVDKRGLTKENYAELRHLLNSTLDGDALIEHGMLNVATRAVTRKFFTVTLRTNNRRKNEVNDAVRNVSTSQVVDALLRIALENLEEDAPAQSGSRKASSKRKVA